MRLGFLFQVCLWQEPFRVSLFLLHIRCRRHFWWAGTTSSICWPIQCPCTVWPSLAFLKGVDGPLYFCLSSWERGEDKLILQMWGVDLKCLFWFFLHWKSQRNWTPFWPMPLWQWLQKERTGSYCLSSVEISAWIHICHVFSVFYSSCPFQIISFTTSFVSNRYFLVCHFNSFVCFLKLF